MLIDQYREAAAIAMTAYGLAAAVILFVVVRTAGKDRVGKALALFLFAYAVGSPTWASSQLSLAGHTWIPERVGQAAFAAFAAGVLVLYFWWLRLASAALPGTFLRNLHGPRPQRILALLPIPVALFFGFAAGGSRVNPWWQVSTLFGAVVAVIVVAAGIQNRRRSPAGTPQRRRANAYLGAFLVHDLSFLHILVAAVPINTGWVSPVGAWAEYWFIAMAVNAVLLTVAFLPLLLYGVLTGRLVDVDARFRVGITQTTAVGIVAAIFFVIVESVEQLFDFSNAAFSVAVAGGLFLAFRPVQRFSERIATRLVPAGKPLAEMDQDERLRLYRDQVALAHADGTVTSAEEEMLALLRKRLGITAAQARAVDSAPA